MSKIDKKPSSRTNKRYSGEFKQKVVEDIRANDLCISEAERKYEINHTVISKWERIFLEEGMQGLYIERRGRATKQDNVKIGRPKKLEKNIEEDLIAENQRLRMENDYLKKLNALVHQKEISANKTKRK